MADAPPTAKPKSGGGMNLTKKVGPLPVWAWALIGLAVGYYLYKHYSGSSTAATGTTPAAAGTDTTPIPVGDQSGGGGGASGSSGPPAVGNGLNRVATGINFMGENTGSSTGSSGSSGVHEHVIQAGGSSGAPAGGGSGGLLGGESVAH